MSQVHEPRRIKPHSNSLVRLSMTGIAIVAIFFGLTGAWASRAPLSGAVVTPGQLVVTSYVKSVQHPNGGVVSELNVSEGAHVKEGDVIVRLDRTVVQAGQQAVAKKLDELYARAARLDAERLNFKPLAFPKWLTDRKDEPNVAEIVSTEKALYDTRNQSLEQGKARFQQQIDQLGSEIEGLSASLAARVQQKKITEKELSNLHRLDLQGLVQVTRLNDTERAAVDLDGQVGQLQAQIAGSKGKIVEIEIQRDNLTESLRTDDTKELREVQADIAQNEEKRIAAEDELRRLEIRAPISGTVLQLQVHTVGGVVKAGDTIMQIVPLNDPLEIEARVAPQDIDQLLTGQDAYVRLLAFNRRSTPELLGKLSRISADTMKDQQTGNMYYTVRVTLPASEIAKLTSQGLKLTAGMQAEVYIRTSERTALEYLVKPLKDQMARAFNER
jgi:HlyD family secretion protein